MAVELHTPEETKSDWFSEGYPALQGKFEIATEGDVTISASRYDALIRAEHTVELIKKAYLNQALKYDSERTEVIKLLLGMEMEDE